jgi:hypothetical protein
MTTIEVIDTAIKIGLGGLLTIAGTFFVTRLNHNHEYKKEKTKRFFDALEQTSALIEEVTHVSLRYWVLVNEWVYNGKLTSDREDELEKTKVSLFNEFKSLTIAESKLLLFGLGKQATLLREYGTHLGKMRSNYFVGKKGLTKNDMAEVRIILLAKREELFKELSNAYKNSPE